MQEDVIAWLKAAEAPALSDEVLDVYYQGTIPRHVFFKNLPTGAHVVDLGAGDGSLHILSKWPYFERNDLSLYAISLDKGVHFDAYREFFLGDFEKSFPSFSREKFDALVCCHFIEHLRDLKRAIEWIASILEDGGRAYIEWPHEIAKQMPRRQQLIDLGYKVSTTNFFDDSTHIDAWPRAHVEKLASQANLSVEASGRIFLPYAATQLRNQGIRNANETALTFGIWSYFGWAQYVILSK